MFPATWYRISSALAQAVKSKSLLTCFYLLLKTTAFEKCTQDLSFSLKSISIVHRLSCGSHYILGILLVIEDWCKGETWRWFRSQYLYWSLSLPAVSFHHSLVTDKDVNEFGSLSASFVWSFHAMTLMRCSLSGCRYWHNRREEWSVPQWAFALISNELVLVQIKGNSVLSALDNWNNIWLHVGEVQHREIR